MKKLKNPAEKDNPKTFDGTPVRVTFFNNTNNAERVIIGTALANTYVEAHKDGHEIGDHTKTHTTSEYTYGIVWKKEISECKDELVSLGIPWRRFDGDSL